MESERLRSVSSASPPSKAKQDLLEDSTLGRAETCASSEGPELGWTGAASEGPSLGCSSTAGLPGRDGTGPAVREVRHAPLGGVTPSERAPGAAVAGAAATGSGAAAGEATTTTALVPGSPAATVHLDSSDSCARCCTISGLAWEQGRLDGHLFRGDGGPLAVQPLLTAGSTALSAGDDGGPGVTGPLLPLGVAGTSSKVSSPSRVASRICTRWGNSPPLMR
mmetsp:Transcript_17402/g.52521  ORF Transcript_17402/g.52521 Transcript_17402/m.52521 type:complete len:222 (+) Transcript_17402:584-1249(+)